MVREADEASSSESLAQDRPPSGGALDQAPPGGEGRRARLRADARFALIAGFVLVLDQATKAVVRARLPHGARWPDADVPVSSIFTFTHVHNTGMAFGLGQGWGGLFLGIAVVVVLVLVAWQRLLAPDEHWVRTALALQAGGAIGNATDRVRLGWVTDFFDFQVWPVFNVADSAITVGVVLLAWRLWREPAIQSAREVVSGFAAGPEPG